LNAYFNLGVSCFLYKKELLVDNNPSEPNINNSTTPMKYIILISLSLLPLLTTSRCFSKEKKQKSSADEAADKITPNKSKDVVNSIGGDFSGVNVSNGRISRCQNGYLEICEGGSTNNCNWRAGNTQELEQYKKDMMAGAEGMESSAKGMEQGAQSMRDSGMSSDSMMSGAESQRQGAKKMRWQAENCKVKG
jgi:hypothetical protein